MLMVSPDELEILNRLLRETKELHEIADGETTHSRIVCRATVALIACLSEMLYKKMREDDARADA